MTHTQGLVCHDLLPCVNCSFKTLLQVERGQGACILGTSKLGCIFVGEELMKQLLLGNVGGVY